MQNPNTIVDISYQIHPADGQTLTQEQTRVYRAWLDQKFENLKLLHNSDIPHDLHEKINIYCIKNSIKVKFIEHGTIK